jgi:hypothetical protein
MLASPFPLSETRIPPPIILDNIPEIFRCRCTWNPSNKQNQSHMTYHSLPPTSILMQWFPYFVQAFDNHVTNTLDALIPWIASECQICPSFNEDQDLRKLQVYFTNVEGGMFMSGGVD